MLNFPRHLSKTDATLAQPYTCSLDRPNSDLEFPGETLDVKPPLNDRRFARILYSPLTWKIHYLKTTRSRFTLLKFQLPVPSFKRVRTIGAKLLRNNQNRTASRVQHSCRPPSTILDSSLAVVAADCWQSLGNDERGIQVLRIANGLDETEPTVFKSLQ
ncbi:hypothetical protein KQX54_018381 [Cotesia glomerata]|uniref:Uncharacterized protein n=1 Tax=Cotesia glomerata TaxID=32391 RepID=A0AAV7HU88_COTGL|nr:hypothetical protein KQX54_018381 [Cotesia glomerata]